MATTSGTEIQQLRELISDRFDKIDERFNKLASDLTDLKVAVGKVDEKLTGLDTRLTSLEARVEKQDGRLWGFVVSAFVGLFALFIKMAFYPGGNP